MPLSLHHFIQLLLVYKYLILFPIAAIEGPIISIIAGFIVSLGFLSLPISLITIVIADVVVDSCYYAMGRYGRKQTLDRWGHLIGLNSQRVARLEQRYAGHIGRSLIFGKLTFVLGVAFLIASGMAKYPFRKFLLINTSITALKSLVLLIIGYYFGKAYAQIGKYFHDAAIWTVALLVIFIVTYIALKIAAQRFTQQDETL